jgi:putative ABC transport system permease protein
MLSGELLERSGPPDAMIPLQYTVRSLRVRRTTTFATALGIALVVFVFSCVLMLANSLQRTMARAGSPEVAVVLKRGADAEVNSHIDQDEAAVVRAAKEVAVNERGLPVAVGELLVVLAFDKIGTDGIGNVAFRGVPDDVMAFRRHVTIVAGRPARAGTDEALIGSSIRGRFQGLDLGQSFELEKNRPATVVGVFSDDGSAYESEVWLDLNVARGVFGREGLLSSLRVRLTSPDAFDAFKVGLEDNRQVALQVQRETEFNEKQAENTTQFIRVTGLMIASFFSVGAMIGAMITMYTSIAHRRREIGIMRALGFPPLQILVCFLVESTLMSLVGGSVGALASLAMRFVHFSTTNFVNWSEIVFSFEPTPGIVIGSLLVASLMGMLGGFFPALRAARLSPLQAIRG